MEAATLVKLGLLVFYLTFTGLNASPLRAFNNPLNNKAVDVFILVDETNLYLNPLQLGLVKTALNNIATDLNPSGSSPYFGVLFYGATSTVNSAVAFPTTSASTVKTKLDQKQYAAGQSLPSTLAMALSQVDSYCQSYCRSTAPRATVIFSSALDTSAEYTIRQLERTRGMTVLVVGIGSTVSSSVMSRLASHPARYYAIPIGSYYDLILAAPHIASVISDVPRPLDINNQLWISSTTSGVYYTVQLNTFAYTTTNDAIVMFASSCSSCSVYGSLSEPNPISDNTIANTNRHNFFAYSGYPNSLYYFRIPKNTGRFYLSFRGTGTSSVYILANVFPLPNLMSIST